MSQDGPSQPTVESIKRIIRRDLKLGDAVVISDDMALVGGELDLDSLDVLLLLTSLEKEFGIKITSETIDRSAFTSVRTLAMYVERRGSPTGQAGAAAVVDPRSLLARLPHGEPFRFVTEVRELRPGVEGVGVWRLDGSEAFFRGHFPGRPLVPGVLVAEALAQLSGIVGLSAGRGGEGRLANVDVRFREAVPPPVEIELRSRLGKSMGGLMQFDVRAGVGERVIAEGTLALNVAGG